MDIELRDDVAVDGAGVRHVDGYVGAVRGAHTCLPEPEISEFE